MAQSDDLREQPLEGIIDQTLLSRVMVIDDGSWTLLGTPADIIKDLTEAITAHEQRLLEQVEKEVIGEDEILPEARQGYDHAQNDLRASQRQALKNLANGEKEPLSQVDRFEVIDERGRAYVRGGIYETPVKVKLDYQDHGKTLKVFVEPRRPNGGKDG